MALDREVKKAVRRLSDILAEYARKQGWKGSDYKVLFYPNVDWGQIHIALIAKSFPKEDEEENWLAIIDFLEEKLKDDPYLRDAIHLVLRTFDQLNEGGLYAVGPAYMELSDL